MSRKDTTTKIQNLVLLKIILLKINSIKQHILRIKLHFLTEKLQMGKKVLFLILPNFSRVYKFFGVFGEGYAKSEDW